MKKIESKQEILARRKEIEQELIDMLKETESDFSLRDIKEVIFYEKDNDDLMRVISMFDRSGDASELDTVIEAVNDAWNYFPHQTLGGLSPAEKMNEYEQAERQEKGGPKSEQCLTAKQKDLLWSGGGGGPYSQANLKRQVRILDDEVSREFLVVEVEINPTTFEIVNKNRRGEEWRGDVAVQQLLDAAEYRGPKLGYVAMAFEAPYNNLENFVRAEEALKYAQESIIRMHKYVMAVLSQTH